MCSLWDLEEIITSPMFYSRYIVSFQLTHFMQAHATWRWLACGHKRMTYKDHALGIGTWSTCGHTKLRTTNSQTGQVANTMLIRYPRVDQSANWLSAIWIVDQQAVNLHLCNRYRAEINQETTVEAQHDRPSVPSRFYYCADKNGNTLLADVTSAASLPSFKRKL